MTRCNCPVCDNTPPADAIQVFQRENDSEYITINGRVIKNWSCSEGAYFYVHEVIGHQLDDGMTLSDLERMYSGNLWPEKVGVFSAEDAVDLYRALIQVRTGI